VTTLGGCCVAADDAGVAASVTGVVGSASAGIASGDVEASRHRRHCAYVLDSMPQRSSSR